MAPVRLRHVHLPSSPSEGLFPTYKTAAAVQEILRRRLLDFKDAESSGSSPPGPPPPTLLSFTPQPTYTLGRRQAQHPSSTSSSSSLTKDDITRLKAPLQIRSPLTQSVAALGVGEGHESSSNLVEKAQIFNPAVLASPRGGLATYHGPGQVVLWPIMAIRGSSLGHSQFSVRCYSRLLEKTTIGLLQRLFGIRAFTTEDPGVWVRTPASATASSSGSSDGPGEGEGGEQQQGEVRKISALGIHLRRHISSLGAAINLDMPVTTSTSPSSPPPRDSSSSSSSETTTNPWSRFTACGLQGKAVTCVADELRLAGGAGIPGLDSEIVARAWADELAKGMGLMADGRQDAVDRVGRRQIEELVAEAESGGLLEAVGRDEL